MFGSTQKGANNYANIGVETGVAAASPHKLIVMLFEGAIAAINAAAQQMKTGNIAGKGQYISKAILIIDDGLRASLNKQIGGDIVENLDALYEYMSNRLITANLNNQPEILEEVHGLLQDIKSAWDAIGTPASTVAQPAAAPPKIPAYDPLAPNTSRLIKA